MSITAPPSAALAKSKRWMLFALLLGGATIAGAWAFQFIGGLTPCPLCLYQRWPYYLGLPIIIAALVLTTRTPKISIDPLLALAALIFAAGAGMGLYHVGVEWQFWPGPNSCSGDGTTLPYSAADLRQSIQQQPTVSCSEAAWRLFGISLAGYNMLISAVIAVALTIALVKTHQPGEGVPNA